VKRGVGEEREGGLLLPRSLVGRPDLALPILSLVSQLVMEPLSLSSPDSGKRNLSVREMDELSNDSSSSWDRPDR
jgi:hypothetical protein